MSGHSLMGFVSSPVYILYLKLKVQHITQTAKRGRIFSVSHSL